jgi:DNA-binding MarR family transcriptional regulator
MVAHQPLPGQSPRAGTKQAHIIALLEREEGVSLDDLIAATGWLPHTTRAALTGLRQRGYGLVKSPGEDGRTCYRISAPRTHPIARESAAVSNQGA